MGSNRAIKILVWLGIIFVIFLAILKSIGLGWIPRALFETTITPKKAYQTFEEGRYSSWNWTPDNRIIYVKNVIMMSHVKSAGPMGYTQEGAKTVIGVIDKDGESNRIIKEIQYLPKMAKRNKRYTELEQEERKGRTWLEQFFNPTPRTEDVEQEVSDGTIDKIYPDPPLAHIGWIDWNAKNNKLVFVANDGAGKTGIAISDPELKEVKWIAENGDHPNWSPEGNLIAYAQFDPQDINNGIWICDGNGSNKKFIKKVEKKMTPEISWFPDNKRIMITEGDVDIAKTIEKNIIIDLEGRTIKELPRMSSPSISPNGQWVVYFDVDTHIMDINGNNRRTVYPYGGHFFPKWSPDGKKILMGWEYQIEIINPDGTGYFEITKGLQSK